LRKRFSKKGFSMSVNDPKKFWSEISQKREWRDYILPQRTLKNFEQEGQKEAERLYYFFDKNDVVIDYGCGIGRVTKFIADHAKKVIGLDINPDFIKKARNFCDKDNAEFYVSDEYSKEGVANFLYSLMVFQHNDKKNRYVILKHIIRLLKKGGTSIMQFPRFESDYYQEGDFVHKFTMKEIEEYAKEFSTYKIVEGNLVNYASEINRKVDHEYFLFARK